MKTPNLVAVFVLCSLTFGFAPNSLSQAVPKKTSEKATLVYSCPMHPEVTSDKPGKCSKCRMNLVLEETAKSTGSQATSASENIATAESLLTEAKNSLMKEGKYSCCIEDACDECALAHQSCPCANNLIAGKDVCTQCYGGWQRGEGAVKGVNVKDVKLGHGHKH